MAEQWREFPVEQPVQQSLALGRHIVSVPQYRSIQIASVGQPQQHRSIEGQREIEAVDDDEGLVPEYGNDIGDGEAGHGHAFIELHRMPQDAVTEVMRPGQRCRRAIGEVVEPGEARAPLCGMGVCHECRVHIQGRIRLACQTAC
eukprot:gene6513-8807_t